MRHFLFCAAAAALTFAPSAVSAQESVEEEQLSAETQAVIDSGGGLNPTREWRIRSRDSGCTASQTFADDSQRVTFVMRRLQPVLDVQFAVIGSGFSHEDTMAAGFVPSGVLIPIGDRNQASIGDRDGFVFARQPFSSAPAMSTMEQMWGNSAEHFIIQGQGRTALVLNTGAIDDVIAQLEECTLSQLRSYGVDLSLNGRLTSLPSITNIRAVTRDLGRAYGRDTSSIFARGPVRVRLVVDSSGRATRCDLITQMARRDLQEITCEVLMREAELDPALDAEGNPVTYFMFQQITFVATVPTNADGSL